MFSGIFIGGIIYFLKSPIYSLLDIAPDYLYFMKYVVGILFIDTICVIPFLNLRLQNKAKKFAAFKLVNILVNVGLILFLISKLKMGIEAIFISNIIASLTSLILLIPTVTENLKITVHKELLVRLFKFGSPLFPGRVGCNDDTEYR